MDIADQIDHETHEDLQTHDRSSLHCNRDQTNLVMVTGNIATNLDRGNERRSNMQARFALTAVAIFLVSKEPIRYFFGCG